MIWNTACPDWEERILSQRSLVPHLPLFPSQTDKALRIFKRLRVPDIEGFPTNGEVCSDWVFDLVKAIFGSYDVVTRRRMIREFFVLVPKKNGKSSLAAAIMVTAIILNRRPSAEFLLIAPTKKIADIAFKQASGIIRLDPALKKLFHPQEHLRTITHYGTLATITIKAADTDVITGSKALGILVDETHEFAKKPKAADVFTEIRGGLAARPDGFMLQITTQSKDPPRGVFSEELKVARDVRDGKVVLPLLPVLYELPEKLAANGGWKERRYWPLVNPNLNKSVDEAFLADQLTKAERADDSVAALALLASQHFNVEIGMSTRAGQWAGAYYWEACGTTPIELSEMLARCEVATVGIDGGGMFDLLGLAVIGREIKTRKWLLWVHAWCHQSVLERHKEIVSQLRDFAAEGSLTIIEDDSEADVEGVADIVEQVFEAGLFPPKNGVGVDPVGIQDIIDAINRRQISFDTDDEEEDEIPEEDDEDGAFGEPQQNKLIVGIRQGWTLTNTIRSLERRLARHGLAHSGTKLMAFALGNAKQEPRGNAIAITKVRDSAKIDPLMATFNAAALMEKNPAAARSAYEDEEFMV